MPQPPQHSAFELCGVRRLHRDSRHHSSAWLAPEPAGGRRWAPPHHAAVELPASSGCTAGRMHSSHRRCPALSRWVPSLYWPRSEGSRPARQQAVREREGRVSESRRGPAAERRSRAAATIIIEHACTGRGGGGPMLCSCAAGLPRLLAAPRPPRDPPPAAARTLAAVEEEHAARLSHLPVKLVRGRHILLQECERRAPALLLSAPLGVARRAGESQCKPAPAGNSC